MASFNDTLQQLVNKEYPEIRKLAASALADILPILQKIDSDNNGMILLHAVIMSAIGADGKLSPKESQLLHDLTGMNNEQIDKFTDVYSSKMVDLCDKFADALNADLKASTVLFLACIAAVDEKISREETAFLRKILE